jgi:DNA polymerase-3 subunit epsilon
MFEMVDAADFARARAGEILEGSGSSVSELKVVTCPDCLTTWTVAASGAQRSRRCADCAPVRTTRQGQSSRAAVPAVEVLTCEACGGTWERQRVRGRKPTRCPACAA